MVQSTRKAVAVRKKALGRSSQLSIMALTLHLGLYGAGQAWAYEPTADEIVQRAFTNLYGFSSVQQVEVRAQLEDGDEYHRTAQLIRSGSASGPNRILARFTSPPDLRGLGVLLKERPDFTYDAFMYQPILGRVRRISVAQRHDAFFGTDIAFEDLEAKRPENWTSRLLREEEFQERPTWVVEMTPRDFPSGYERIVAWFDVATPLMLRADFYRNGKVLKSLVVDPARVQKIDGYTVPQRLIFRGSKGTTTTVDLLEIDLREKIPAQRFTLTGLEMGDTDRDAR